MYLAWGEDTLEAGGGITLIMTLECAMRAVGAERSYTCYRRSGSEGGEKLAPREGGD